MTAFTKPGEFCDLYAALTVHLGVHTCWYMCATAVWRLVRPGIPGGLQEKERDARRAEEHNPF